MGKHGVAVSGRRDGDQNMGDRIQNSCSIRQGGRSIELVNRRQLAGHDIRFLGIANAGGAGDAPLSVGQCCRQGRRAIAHAKTEEMIAQCHLLSLNFVEKSLYPTSSRLQITMAMVHFSRLFSILLLFVAVSASAGEAEDAAEYSACMIEAEKEPNKAYVRAVRWRDLGGAEAAEHCAATALSGMELYDDAATRFEKLAQKGKVTQHQAAQLLGQASQAWLLAADAARAEATATSALELAPEQDLTRAGLLVDRAQARAARKDYMAAMADLDQALAINRTDADAFVFRATAKRYLDRLGAALKDLDEALLLEGGHADALLERGIVYRLKGDEAAARRDWMTLLRTAPLSPAADAARTNLERMDVKAR